MYKEGDKVVLKQHGLSEIKRIITKGDKDFYQVNCNMITVIIPVDDKSLLRPLVDEMDAEDILNFIKNEKVKVMDNGTWNKRYRQYIDEINTGDLHKVAKVYKCLLSLQNIKDLSFGERKMLDFAKRLLVDELSVVLGKTPDILETA